MENKWMAYICGDGCCERISTKETYNYVNGALGYYRDEIDSVLLQAKDKLSNTFVDVYDRIIDILAMAHKPDVTEIQIQLFYREIIDLLQDPEKQNTYAEKVQEDVQAAQDAAISATMLFYPPVIVAYMGAKPARVMKPKIRTPELNEFHTGFSFGGDSISDLVRQTSTDTFTRFIVRMTENASNPDVNREDFIRDVNEAIDVIDSYAENISTTEIMETSRNVVQWINRLNPNVVRGYRRVAVIDNKTCVGCLALHGKVYSTNDGFESHPRCRCMLVPISATWMQYAGVQGGAVPSDLSRDELIAMLPREVLADILGPARMKLYDDGVPIDRMIYIEQTEEYGQLIRITPLSSLREQGVS